MTEIAIDRLTLKLSGLSRGDGERLARLVANGLGQASLSGGAAKEVASMSISIRPEAGNNLNRLSDQIVSEILRQLTV